MKTKTETETLLTDDSEPELPAHIQEIIQRVKEASASFKASGQSTHMLQESLAASRVRSGLSSAESAI